MSSSRIQTAATYDTRIRQLLHALADVAICVGLRPTLDVLLASLRDVAPFDAGGIFVRHGVDGSLQAVATRGYPSTLGLVEASSLTAAVVRSGEPRLVTAVARDPDYSPARPSTQSQLTVPLRSARGVIGAITLESDRAGAFDEQDLSLLGLFAGQAAVAIERALLHEQTMRRSRLDREIEIAADIVRQLTPAAPRVPGLDVHGRSVVAASVGGDAFDFVVHADGQLGLAIADPKGKGLPAALLATAHRSMLRALASVDLRLRTVFARMDDILQQSVQVGDFVTAFYGVIDVTQRAMVYVNAGHVPALVLRADGGFELLEPTGAPLGFPQSLPISEGYVNFSPGDGIVLYTDGVTEAGTSPDDFFEIAGLQACIRASWSRSAQAICDAVIEEVVRRCGGEVNDDATLVVAKLLPG